MNEIAKHKAAIEDAETQNKVSNPTTCICAAKRNIKVCFVNLMSLLFVLHFGSFETKDGFLLAIGTPGFFDLHL